MSWMSRAGIDEHADVPANTNEELKITLELKKDVLLLFFESVLPEISKTTHAHMTRVLMESLADRDARLLAELEAALPEKMNYGDVDEYDEGYAEGHNGAIREVQKAIRTVLTRKEASDG